MYTYISLIVFVSIAVINGNFISNHSPYEIRRIPSVSDSRGLGLKVCEDCINEAVELINVALNLILDKGVIGSCGDFCDALSNRTNSTAVGDLCLAVCDVIGIGELVKILEHTDLDPIWYCQIVKLCPINDNGDAKFVDFHMIPSTARVGTEFIIDCSFTSKNGTGPGMLTIVIVTPQNETASNNFLLDERKPGTYDQRIGVKTLTMDCNPTNGPCNGFPTGTYNVTAYMCNGECGSQHPHSTIYDVGHSYFTVTP